MACVALESFRSALRVIDPARIAQVRERRGGLRDSHR